MSKDGACQFEVYKAREVYGIRPRTIEAVLCGLGPTAGIHRMNCRCPVAHHAFVSFGDTKAIESLSDGTEHGRA